MTGHKIAGMALVLVGLLFVNAKGKGLGEEKQSRYTLYLCLYRVFATLFRNCLIKMLMQSMNSGQLQFLVYVLYGNIVFGLYDCNQKQK